MGRRLNLVVDDDIPDLLRQLAGGERRQGAYLSAAIRQIAQGLTTASPIDPTRCAEIVAGATVLTEQLTAFAQLLQESAANGAEDHATHS